MSAAWWDEQRRRWRLDAALARYAHQDIHKLRGVKKLSYDEKTVFNEHVKELMTAEFSPLNDDSGATAEADD